MGPWPGRAAHVGRSGAGGRGAGAGPDPGRRALVRARHFFGFGGPNWAAMPLPPPTSRARDAPASATTRWSSAPDPTASPAAALLARAGRSVLLLEAAEKIGGGASTEELTPCRGTGTTCAPRSIRSQPDPPRSHRSRFERHGLRARPPGAHAGTPARRRHRRRHRPRLLRDRRVTRCRRRPLAVNIRAARAVGTHSSKTCRVRSSTCHVTRFGSRAFGIPSLAPRPPHAAAFPGNRGPHALFSGMAAHTMLPLTHPRDRVVRPRVGRSRARGRLARRSEAAHNRSATCSPAS